MQAVYDSLSPEELQVYAEKAGIGEKIPVDYLEFKKYLHAGQKILEVGCGTGRIGTLLLNDGYDYWGIDAHKPYLDYFQGRLEDSEKKTRLFHGLFEQFTENGFDVILFPWSVICDWEDQESILKKAFSLLDAGGLVILDNPAPGTEYNTHEGYSPKPFYFSDWKEKCTSIGFKKSTSSIYNTPVGRQRELTLLYKK